MHQAIPRMILSSLSYAGCNKGSNSMDLYAAGCKVM